MAQSWLVSETNVGQKPAKPGGKSAKCWLNRPRAAMPVTQIIRFADILSSLCGFAWERVGPLQDRKHSNPQNRAKAHQKYTTKRLSGIFGAFLPYFASRGIFLFSRRPTLSQGFTQRSGRDVPDVPGLTPMSRQVGKPQMWERAHVGFGGTRRKRKGPCMKQCLWQKHSMCDACLAEACLPKL